METKEQKPWYQGVKWTEEFYGDDVLPTAIHFGHNDRVCFMPTPGSGEQADAQRIKRHAKLIAAAPETATQRDSLLSVQKQLVEALEALLPIAEVGEYLTEAHSYSYGDGYSQPFEYGIDWQWQQSSPDLKHGPFALQADVDSWIKDQIETAKDDEVECVLESVKARAAILAAKASS